jgi:hypothetical protein
MDRGVWAISYDLPENGREEFFDWLHGTHLPALTARPGYLWAASYKVEEDVPPPGDQVYDIARDGPGLGSEGVDLPSGSQFIQLVGAAESSVFFNPAVDTIPEVTDAAARAMLARRRNARVSIMIEESRVNGPEARVRPLATAPGPVIQLGALRQTSIEAQFGLGAWYIQDRMMQMAAASGSIAMRKFAVVAGWAKHAPLYEFTSLEARDSFFATLGERILPEHVPLMESVTSQTLHAPGSPALATRIWPE